MTKNPINTASKTNPTASDSTSDSRRIQSPESDALTARFIDVLGDEPVASFARRASVKESTLRNILNGAFPRTDNLVAIANAGGVTVDWLATGRGPKTRAPALSNGHYAPSQAPSMFKAAEPTADAAGMAGYVAIPLYSEVRAAAGHGAVNERERADDFLMFKEAWIRHELGARPQDLWLIKDHGDSMETTVRSGDVILVDGRATWPDREGIYILRIGETLLVKRLQLLPGRRIRVSSENAAFEPWDIDGGSDDGDDTQIIGRVVWHGRRL